MLYLVAQNLGLWHVTQRHDRDNYVRVVTSNLLPAYQSDLLKLNESTGLLKTFGLPYDFASLMHFPAQVSHPLYIHQRAHNVECVSIIVGSSVFSCGTYLLLTDPSSDCRKILHGDLKLL